MSVEKVRAARARVYGPPEGVAPDAKVHVYVFDVFHETLQFQRHEQERIYTEQEATPELFDLPFLSTDPDLVARIGRDEEYRKRLLRDLKGDARSRGKRH